MNFCCCSLLEGERKGGFGMVCILKGFFGWVKVSLFLKVANLQIHRNDTWNTGLMFKTSENMYVYPGLISRFSTNDSSRHIPSTMTSKLRTKLVSNVGNAVNVIVSPEFLLIETSHCSGIQCLSREIPTLIQSLIQSLQTFSSDP